MLNVSGWLANFRNGQATKIKVRNKILNQRAVQGIKQIAESPEMVCLTKT